MRIVRPTEPPSMKVIVDTIVFGEVELAVTQQTVPQKERIDAVITKEGTVAIIPGTPAVSPCAPALPTGARLLARIHLNFGMPSIWMGCIEEVL